MQALATGPVVEAPTTLTLVGRRRDEQESHDASFRKNTPTNTAMHRDDGPHSSLDDWLFGSGVPDDFFIPDELERVGPMPVRIRRSPPHLATTIPRIESPFQN